MIDAFNVPTIWQPFGAFSMVAVRGDGQIVHLKGQVALDREGRIVGKGDMRVQTRNVLENIQEVLAAMGGRMEDVFSLTHYVTDIKGFAGVGDVRREFFREPFPVTTTVQVAALYHPDLVVEIAAVAEIPRKRFRHQRQGQ
ncbi:MAG TPA: RidA family protein [Stellaceae bacterium]|nr:RidA family protein [Stellaceae bacterium]